jgi:hypothetical protein
MPANRPWKSVEGITVGFLRFEPRISVEQLTTYIDQNWFEKDQMRWRVFIYPIQDGQKVVMFEYALKGESASGFHYRLTDQLRRAFGNGLLGFSISNNLWAPTPH